MFTTEITLHDKTRPTTTGSVRRDFNTLSSATATVKVKVLKEQVKQLDKQYTKALSQFSKTKKSIDNSRKQSQRIRVNFLKMYENKKMKINEKKLVEEKKLLDHEYRQASLKKVKQRKFNNEIQLSVIKTENEHTRANTREKNRKQRLALKNYLAEQKAFFEEQAKIKFQKQKNHENDFQIKKRKMEEILIQKSRHNYLKKMEQELAMLHSFDNLMGTVEGLPELEEDKILSGKSFFVTNDHQE